MTTQPYASAQRAFWVVDNGSSHRGQASVDRAAKAWRNLNTVQLGWYEDFDGCGRGVSSVQGSGVRGGLLGSE